MIKKHKFAKTKETDRAREELKGLGDLPLVGGLFKGLEKFIDLAEEVEEAGGEIKRKGEIKGDDGKIKGIYGFSIKSGIGDRPRVQTFGNIRPIEKKAGKREIEITETREPIVDVFDEKNHILVVAELPGVSEESIKLELKGDILILEAGDEPSFAKASEGKGKGKYYKEILLPASVRGEARPNGRPAKVDFEQRETNFKNGILEIKIKKI